MLRQLTSTFYRRVASIAFKDILDKEVSIVLPTKRGDFNPYQVYLQKKT